MNEIVKEKPKFHGWHVCIGGFIITGFSMYLVGNAGSFYMPFVAADLGVSISTYSWMFTISPITTAIAVGFLGPKMQKGNLRMLMLICAVITGAGLALQGFATQMWQLYIIWGITTLGAGGLTNFPITLLMTNWFTDNRGLATGIAFAGNSVCGIFLSPFVNGMINSIGWRMAFHVSGLIVLATAIPTILFLIKRKPEDIGEKPYLLTEEQKSSKKQVVNKGVDPGYAGVTVGVARKTPAFYLCALTFFGIGAVASGIMIHVPNYLINIGSQAIWVSTVMSVYSACGILGKLVVGKIFDRAGMVGGMAFTCFFLAFASIFLIVAQGNTTLALGYSLGMGLGLGIASIGPPLLISMSFGKKDYGAIFGALNVIFMLGNIVGPVLSGYIFDITKNYTMVWIIYAVFAVLIFVLGFLTYRASKPLHEKYRIENEPKKA